MGRRGQRMSRAALLVATVGIILPTAASAADDIEASASATVMARRLTPQPQRPPDGSEYCPELGHAAIIDRDAQRAWLCTDGIADAKFPITTAADQPLPRIYRVYAKDRLTTSNCHGRLCYLDNFVAFTRGIHYGARVAFHAVPRTAGGAPFQPYDAVGTPEWYGQSAGCIRVTPLQSVVIWNHLRVGDAVIVVN